MQMELIRKIVWLNNRGIRPRKCILIKSLILPHFSVVKEASKARYVLVPVTFREKVLWIKKRGDGPNQWTNLRRCSQWESVDSRILRCFDAKIASALEKIIMNPYFKKRVSLEEQKAKLDDRFILRR